MIFLIWIISDHTNIKKGVLVENKEFQTKFLSSLNKYNDQNEFGVKAFKPQKKIDYAHHHQSNSNIEINQKGPFKKIRDPILDGEILKSTIPKKVINF